MSSLLVIVAISAVVPLIVGLTPIKVAEVVLLIVGGIIFGPHVLGWIQVDAPNDLLAEMGLGLLFFLAGIIIRRYAPPSEESKLHTPIEGIAFGFFIPIFFIISGANLDIISIIQNPLTLLVFFVLLLLVRGLPQFFIYRKMIPDAFQRGRFALLVATGLPMIVAITTLEVESGAMLPKNAAGLVGAGALSVLVFPIIANALGKKVRNPLPDEVIA
ncbi:MAG: hypothetical protein EXQ60_06935, partial [Candidatus Nanopelagicales bacterium]|nr:hypothetical protein [Candidatus Nanopelagicales bacterium]